MRQARAEAEPVAPAPGLMLKPHRATPLFTVTIRCCDGQSASIQIHETPFGLSVSPTLAGRKVACVIQNYRPAP